MLIFLITRLNPKWRTYFLKIYRLAWNSIYWGFWGSPIMNPKIDFENPRCWTQYSGLDYWVSVILGLPSSILKIWPEIRHQRPQKVPYNKFATNRLIFKNFVPHLGSAILNLANLTSDSWSVTSKITVYQIWLKSVDFQKNKIRSNQKNQPRAHLNMVALIWQPEAGEKSSIQQKKLVKIKIRKRSCRFLAQIVADGRP